MADTKLITVNYEVDENNVLINYWSRPILSQFPTIEIPEDLDLFIGFDTIVDGKLWHDEKAYEIWWTHKRDQQIIKNEIEALTNKLATSDYKAIKHSEGLISDEDYETIKQEREAIRVQIRELQKQLDN